MLLVFLWAQPLYWFLRRRTRLDQEALADAAAAELTSRQHYAEQLVAWARNIGSRRTMRLSSAVGLWEGPHNSGSESPCSSTTASSSFATSPASCNLPPSLSVRSPPPRSHSSRFEPAQSKPQEKPATSGNAPCKQ